MHSATEGHGADGDLATAALYTLTSNGFRTGTMHSPTHRAALVTDGWNISVATITTIATLVANSPMFSADDVSATFVGANVTAGDVADPADLHPAHQYVIIVCAPLLFCVGVPCNVLAATVMMRRHYRETSTGVYLFFLAVFDAIFLTVNSITKRFVKIVIDVDLNKLSTSSCKIYVYLLFTSKCLSAWFVVAVTLERLLVVCVPHKAKVISTRGRAWVISSLLICCVALCFAYVPYMYDLGQSRGTSACTITVVNKGFMQMIHKVVDFVIYSVVPFLTLLVSNVVLVLTVVRSRQQVRTSASRKESEEIRRMTATLLVVSFLFLLCTSPMAIFLALAAYIKSIEKLANFRVVYYSLYCVQLSNSTVNFWVYCLSGPAFRREVATLFRCGPHRKSPHQMATIFKVATNGLPERARNGVVVV